MHLGRGIRIIRYLKQTDKTVRLSSVRKPLKKLIRNRCTLNWYLLPSLNDRFCSPCYRISVGVTTFLTKNRHLRSQSFPQIASSLLSKQNLRHSQFNYLRNSPINHIWSTDTLALFFIKHLDHF